MKITSVRLIAGFAEDRRVPLSAGPVFLDLEKRLGARLVPLTVPEVVPPEAPRLLLQASQFTVALSLNQLELVGQVPSHVANDATQAIQFVQGLADVVFPAIESLGLRFEWTGAISECHIPADQPGIGMWDAITPIADKIARLPRRNRPLATFQLQWGVFDDGIYKGWTINGYELRDATVVVPTNQPAPVKVPLSSTTLREAGLRVDVDVNNKRRRNRDPLADEIRVILGLHRDIAANLLREIGLEE